jgi:hypothetical protein
MSVLPPGAQGMMIRTDFSGQADCATTGSAHPIEIAPIVAATAC